MVAFVQNKPNFMRFYAKNPDSTKKQSQTNPIQTHFYPQKPPHKPKQTQNKLDLKGTAPTLDDMDDIEILNG